MKLKNEFIKSTIADECIVIPVGERVVDFSGIIKLNETGEFLWDRLQRDTTKETLCSEMLKEHGVDEAQAMEDVEAFLSLLKEKNLLEE